MHINQIKAVEPIDKHVIEVVDTKELAKNSSVITVDESKNEAPQSYKWAILVALQGKNIYLGTVAPAEKARRRAANKVARKSRRANR